tara:strand:- start:759 stop:1271 length:513 start_codon:yes stop_codon:yes gene_type:complete
MLSEEERSDLISECNSMGGLNEWLENLNRRPGLSELDVRLSKLEPNIQAIERCIGYSEYGYQRNIINKNEYYELVAICWSSGQETPIHDHTGSDCAFLILAGTCTETVYETNDDGLATPTLSREYKPGGICAAEEADIHRISNESNENLINLHVYTPPLRDFNIYAPAEE